jgi:hypothetical protein
VAESLADMVKRDSCPVRRSFVQRDSPDEGLTPLARLLRTQDEVGGKGAGLRITLLLSVLWICAKEPYTTTRVAPYWAELLSRQDPAEEGARAIRDCLRELKSRGLVDLRARGNRIEIAPSLETSTAELPFPYLPPYQDEPYISVPRAFWTSGVAGALSGAGTAMYLCALAMTRHDQSSFFISGDFFDTHYGISRSSRKRGLSELQKLGVLSAEVVEGVSLETFKKTKRNVYTLAPDFAQPGPREIPPEEQARIDASRAKARQKAEAMKAIEKLMKVPTEK